jgi:hypothetical protein
VRLSQFSPANRARQIDKELARTANFPAAFAFLGDLQIVAINGFQIGIREHRICQTGLARQIGGFIWGIGADGDWLNSLLREGIE